MMLSADTGRADCTSIERQSAIIHDMHNELAAGCKIKHYIVDFFQHNSIYLICSL